MASTLTNLLVHVIFSTKQRQPFIHDALRPELHAYAAAVCAEDGAPVIVVGSATDHIHLVLRFRAEFALSDTVRALKSNTSRWINQRFPPDNARFAWQSGYAAYTVSESRLPVLRKYLQNQLAHHRRVSFQAEYLLFLERHRVDYDKRHVFD